ncbi:hypothetical protein COO60DRAFT_258858 [Scenedesmus sp. NREL 46B-D3]|nr:hypothetical protein COO60DRAFT_258858 [Scenedesmus sp. NREL 46B-D3]
MQLFVRTKHWIAAGQTCALRNFFVVVWSAACFVSTGRSVWLCNASLSRHLAQSVQRTMRTTPSQCIVLLLLSLIPERGEFTELCKLRHHCCCLLQTRLEGVRELVIATQQGVAMKRAAAIREVQSAARALLKALKLERKARHKGNTSSKIGRQLDLAMGDDLSGTNQNNMSSTGAAFSLDAAMESFKALERSSAGGSSAYAFDALVQQRRQQQQQQWQQQEEWVQDWARLLERARRTLRESLASGSSSSSLGVAGSSLAEDYEAEVEAELQALAAKAAQRSAAQQAELAAAQQVIESQFRTITAAPAAAAAAAAAAAIGDGACI